MSATSARGPIAAGGPPAPAGATPPQARAAARRAGARAVSLVVEVAPLALVIVAEAAWISILAGLFQEFALREPRLGIPSLAAVVALGVVLARVLAPRLDRRWPGIAFGLVLGAAVVGVLSSPAALAEAPRGLGPTLAENPGGLLAGLALLRGFAHARLPLLEGTVTNLLSIGIPGLAAAATVGGLIVDPFRTRFLGDAFGAAIVFISASVLALAFTRLDNVGLDGGFDWRRNPPWLLLTIAVLALAIVAAIPLAAVAGTVISLVISVAFGPLLILGLATGFDRVVRRLAVFFGAAVFAVLVLIRLFGSEADPPQPAQAGPGQQVPPSAAEQIVTMSVGGIVLLVLIVGTMVLIAIWMRRNPAPSGVLGEQRTIDPSGAGLSPRPRRGRFGRRAEPRSAVQAYVALIDDLDRRPDVRREPAETPAAHAARLRSMDRAFLSMDLLAADYALARYGGLDLSDREDRRAIRRWRLLRRRLAIKPPNARTGRGAAEAPDAVPPEDVEVRRTM